MDREEIIARAREVAADWQARFMRLSGAQLFVRSGACLFLALLLWAAIGDLDVVANAGGEVIPHSQVKTVQHLEGGIVAEILVREGDTVAIDQPLVALATTASDAQVGEIAVRLGALRLDVLRLEAEAAGSDRLDLPEDIRRDHPAEAKAVGELFRSRRERFHAQIASQNQAIAQREQSQAEIAARLRNSRNTLVLIEEQVRIGEDLLKDDLTNRYSHLVLLRDRSALRSRIDEDSAALRRAELAIGEARSQIEAIRHAYDQDVKEQLSAAQRNHDEFQQRLRRLTDSQSRTVIRSPVEGVVKTLHVATQGGVIAPGGAVADIVPAGDRLIIEARLPVQDVGHVRSGQQARIRLASAESARFGAIDGKVVHISPDTLTTDRGAAYYRVRIETDQDHFESGAERYRLYPGVQVEAGIVTGQRSVLRYLLDPFLGYSGRALQER